MWSWSELSRKLRLHKNVAVTTRNVGTCVEFPVLNLLKWGNSSDDIRDAIPCRLAIPGPKATAVISVYCNDRIVCSQHVNAILWTTASMRTCSKTSNARANETYRDRPLRDSGRCSRRLGVRLPRAVSRVINFVASSLQVHQRISQMLNSHRVSLCEVGVTVFRTAVFYCFKSSSYKRLEIVVSTTQYKKSPKAFL
jgi:hypothetical protein